MDQSPAKSPGKGSKIPTPIKQSSQISWTPRGKTELCLLCGKRVPTGEKLRLFHGIQMNKSDICLVIEQALQINVNAHLHPSNVCRACAAKCRTIKKKQEDMLNLFKETLAVISGKYVVQRQKRLQPSSPEVKKPSSKRALFPSLPIPSEDASTSLVKPSAVFQVEKSIQTPKQSNENMVSLSEYCSKL